MRILRRLLATFLGIALLSACGGGDGSGTPAPTASLTISPQSIPAYQDATLTWSSTNSSTCQASGAWNGSQSTSGNIAVSQASPGSYTYTLSCSSGGASPATASATLTVTAVPMAISGALSSGVIGVTFNESLQATRGVAPFTWKVSSGTLPHNLSLSPSTTDTVTISGTPDTAEQGQSFTIQVTDSANNTASQSFVVSVLLQGDSLVLSSAGLNFASQAVGKPSAALTETLTNAAGSDIEISNVTITANQDSNAGEFAQSSTTCGSILAAGASCAINVTFTPGEAGPRGAALSITDNTAGSPQSVGLSGVGVSSGPNATLTAASLPFGTQLVGTTSPGLTLALSNYGAVALNVTSIVASSQFAENDNCVGNLASLASCTISVTFTPASSGDMTGTLSVSDNAASSPQTVSLSGTGSTNTPTLTGYCVVVCIPQKPSEPAACPPGQPAHHPFGLYCPAGPLLGHSTPVDESRPCFVGGSTRIGPGFCETH